MNIKNVYILEDRGILFVNGLDAKEFLQNLVTNDINKVDNSNSCFASLLTPQGKFLFDFLIIQHKNGYFIDCEKKQIEELFRQLNLYKLRSKIEITNLSNEFVIATFSYEKFMSFITTDRACCSSSAAHQGAAPREAVPPCRRWWCAWRWCAWSGPGFVSCKLER